MVLVTCSYKNQEFIRVGYYVNNELEGFALGGDSKAEGDTMDEDVEGEEDEEEEEDEEDEEEGEEGEEEEGEEEGDGAAVGEEGTGRAGSGGDSDVDMTEVRVPPNAGSATEATPGLPVLPDDLDVSKIRRSILADKPRITRFAVLWD